MSVLTRKLVVLSGAGISAESGLRTFRDSDGLWEEHDIMEVASIEGWRRNPKLVLEFYNQRRSQAAKAQPNAAHLALAYAEKDFDVRIITQNVDRLHERAGSSQVLHLHGCLDQARCSMDASFVVDIGDRPIFLGDLSANGHQLRPNIVWFGEPVSSLAEAARWVSQADVLLIVGTSLSVYPAASLVDFASTKAEIFLVDPVTEWVHPSVEHFPEPASTGVPRALDVIRRWA